MKRYNFLPIDTMSGCMIYGGRVQEIETDDGEWVLYSDIQNLMFTLSVLQTENDMLMGNIEAEQPLGTIKAGVE